MHYLRVFSTLFSTGLYDAAFSNFTFGKLGFRISVFSEFSSCSVF